MSKRLFSFAFTFFLLFTATAHANAELDRKYSIDTVGFLKSTDNVDGLFSDYVSAAFKEYFNTQSRFVLIDVSKADTVLGKAKTPYQKLIQDRDILNQVARATRAENLIRTQVLKEGSQYRFTLEWLHAPEIELLVSETFTLAETRGTNKDAPISGLGDVNQALMQGVDRLVKKLPFQGNVTGRDNDSVTVNLGSTSGLHMGDELVISTLDEVKKHPLLKEIVEWRLAPVGRVRVETVDERISFCRVVEEEPNRRISRFQKIVQINKYVEPKVQSVAPPVEEVRKPEFVPHLGWVSGGLGIGTFSRTYTLAAPAVSLSGSGMPMIPSFEGQLWLTNNWFAELGFDYGFWSYSQTTSAGAATAGGAVSSFGSKFRINGGYSIIPATALTAIKGWVRLGLESASFTLPVSATEYTAPLSMSSIFLGLGGEIPIFQVYTAFVNMQYGLFPSASEVGATTTSAASASAASFTLGGSYLYSQRLVFRCSLSLQNYGATFTSGPDISHSLITLTPSVLFYF